MKLIGRIRPFNLQSIKIEQIHRTALGLLSGTSVHLSYLPSAMQDASHAELLLTTIPPRNWGRLCRVTARMNDQPGVVASVVNAMTESECNILILETLTTSGQDEHELLAFVAPTEGSERKDSEDFLAFLKTSLNDKLNSQRKDGKSILIGLPHVDELLSLKRAHTLREANRVEGKSVPGIVDKYGIQASSTEVEKLFPIDLEGRPTIPSRFVCYSDTEEKYICMYFPSDGSLLVSLTINHTEQPGVIKQFADEFMSHNANILNSFLRLRRTGFDAQWCLIVDMTNVASIGNLLRAIERKAPVFKSFADLEISYTKQLERPPSETNPFHFIDENFNEELMIPRSALASPIISSLSEQPIEGVQNENFVLSGYYKTGKSTLLRAVERQLLNRKDLLAVSWNLKSQPAGRFWPQLVEDLENTINHRLGGLNVARGWLGRQTKGAKQAVKKIGFMTAEVEFDKNSAAVEYAREVIDKLSKMVAQIRSRNILRVVVFLDEGQTLLTPQSAEARLALQTWQVVSQSLPGFSWIFAASDRWKSTDGGSGVAAKMHEIRMTGLEPSEALELIVRAFEKREKYLSKRLGEEIVELTGCQPCYLQAVGNAIFERLATAPINADVVDRRILKAAIPVACAKLNAHFTEMRRELVQILTADRTDKLLQLSAGTAFSLEQIRLEPVSGTAPSSFYLDAIPGFVNRRHEDGSSKLSVTPLFQFWHKTVLHR